MRRTVLLIALFALVASSLRADPYVGYAYPSGIQVGTTNRLVIGGQRLWGLSGGWVSGEGVEVVKVERVPNFGVPNGRGQREWLEKWVYGILAGRRKMPSRAKVKDTDLVGWSRCKWWETMDELPPLEFSMVAHYLFTPRNALQMSPSLAERAIVTVVARPDAQPGVRRFVLFDARGASAPRPLLVTTEPHVAEPLYRPPPRKRVGAPTGEATSRSRRLPPVGGGDQEVVVPSAKPPVVFEGQILPGETDVFRLELKGGARLMCLTTARELTPYLGDAVPGFFNPVLRLTDEAGEEIAFADDYGYLPDPVLVCEVPSNGVYRLEIRDNLYRGRADFVYSIACFADGRELPSVANRAFAAVPFGAISFAPTAVSSKPPYQTCGDEGRAHDLGRAASMMPPQCRVPSSACQGNGPSVVGAWTWRGALAEPGAVAEHDFEISEAGTWQFETFARRNGSPLDGVMKLFGPMTGLFWTSGPLLVTWDDVTNAVFVGSVPQAECDPVGCWTFAEPGIYRLVVSDRVGGGGDGYQFALSAKPVEPSFEAYASKSTFVLPPGKNERFKFNVRIVRRNGFAGPVALDGDGVFKFTPAHVAATAEVVTVTAQPLRRGWTGPREFRFSARAEVSPGCERTIPIVPADEMEQAFAYTHLLPSDAFRVFIHRQPPLGPAETPSWIAMPHDEFLPRRVIRPHGVMPDGKPSGAMLDELAKVDIPIMVAPTNAGEAVLAAKFAVAAAHLRPQRSMPAVAFEPTDERGFDRTAGAVLAGIERFVDRQLDYRDGDARRVRTMARAVALPHDNDVLVYVPAGETDPLAGETGCVARRLGDQGWSFDFVTDKTVSRAPCGRLYRAVVVPGETNALPAETRATLELYEKKRNFRIVFDEGDAKKVNAKLAAKCRRDVLPRGVRFARYGQDWGENWYFVHNPTKKAASGDWKFAIRGRPQTAFAMDVGSGKVEALRRKGKGNNVHFAYSLAPGASAWIYVTVRERK